MRISVTLTLDMTPEQVAEYAHQIPEGQDVRKWIAEDLGAPGAVSEAGDLTVTVHGTDTPRLILSTGDLAEITRAISDDGTVTERLSDDTEIEIVRASEAL